MQQFCLVRCRVAEFSVQVVRDGRVYRNFCNSTDSPGLQFFLWRISSKEEERTAAGFDPSLY